MEASLRGASEIGFTVISLTVSLIAVFIPLLFMSGLVGRMFREFALTLTIAVVTSGDRLADADADDVLAAVETCRRGIRGSPALPPSVPASTAWWSSIIARCCGCCGASAPP